MPYVQPAKYYSKENSSIIFFKAKKKKRYFSLAISMMLLLLNALQIGDDFLFEIEELNKYSLFFWKS